MLNKYILGASLLLASLIAQAGEAGRVVFVTGQVQAANRAVALDAVVNEGDEFVTGADGYVYIKTVDAGFLILRPNSRALVQAYKVDPKNPANTKVKLELKQGVARAISGTGVKQARQNFRFNTPVAAIGVRGTDFIVYTDQQTSRVQVISGGVVMAPLAGGCTADGVGPCEGNAARELFAGQAGMLLQVQRGQAAPQLLNNPALVPDKTEKPRPDEPVGKVTTASTLGTGVVDLEPQKAQQSLTTARATNVGPATTPPVTPEVPVTPVLPELPPVVVSFPPKVQEVFWGRWAVVAGQAVMPSAIARNNTDTPLFVGDYAIARVKDAPLVMPNEGTVAFTMTGGEALVQRTSGADSRGVIQSSKLAINFADRTFNTGLVIANGDNKYNVNGNGVVDYKGVMMHGDSSPTQIRGFLSGANAEEAGYIFRNSENPGVVISGATTWKR